MVKEQIQGRGIDRAELLDAFRTVPREKFVPDKHRSRAYQDCALPTDEGQTISQPYIVARMTDLLDVSAGDRVLEVGTGSGYQAAILVEMGIQVYTIERVPQLARKARKRLERLGYGSNVFVKTGDGTEGWAENAPYHGIVVTAGSPKIPETLKAQLSIGGNLVIPVGTRDQQYVTLVTRESRNEWSQQRQAPCVFVPLVGEEGWESGDE